LPKDTFVLYKRANLWWQAHEPVINLEQLAA